MTDDYPVVISTGQPVPQSAKFPMTCLPNLSVLVLHQAGEKPPA